MPLPKNLIVKKEAKNEKNKDLDFGEEFIEKGKKGEK